MDGAEITWRIRRLLRDQFDSIRIPLGLIPSIPAGKLPTANDFEPGFKCSPVTQADWLDPISKNQQVWRSRLIEKADLILNNRLSYFDLESVHHGDPINWHRDFSAGIDAPVILSIRTDYRDFRKFGDCKLVWEPNRHHQLVVLGRAYVASGERKYALKVAELLRSWIDANPFGYGMNWKSPLELGVRLINWVWTIDLVRNAGVFDDELWADILQTANLTMWDCERKFSQGSSANNHLIGEAAGVFVAGCYFDCLPNAAKWRRSSRAVLEREILAQTYPDGCTREHAFAYQFFVIQFFLLCMRAGNAKASTFSNEFAQRLHKMYRFLDEISADTGRPPDMGDRDDGYVLDLGDLPHDARELLSVGGHQFEDGDLISSNSSESVFWLLGNVQQTSASRKPRASVSFVDSGYSILRSKRMSVFFDCAELGYGPIAAHGHADCLSFCLYVDGHPIFIDPGTYDYFTHPEWRNYLRKTKAHNTIEVDGQSQSQMLGPFIWGRRANGELIDWQDSPQSTLVCGQHDGYSTLPDPVTHQRSIELLKDSHAVSIVDIISANSTHTLRTHFHLAPGHTVSSTSNSTADITLKSGDRLRMHTLGASIALIRANENTKLGWISRSYHRKEISTCLRIEQVIHGPTKSITHFELL